MPRPLRLGEPYGGRRGTWPPGVVVVLVPGRLELRLFVPHPRAEVVEAVRTGRAEVALAELPSTLLVAARFGDPDDGLSWLAARYVDVLGPHGRDGFPAWLGEAASVELRVILVDSETALIHGLRTLPLPRAATRRLAAAIWRQHHEPGDPDDADRALAAPDALERLLADPRTARVVADDLALPLLALDEA